MLRALFIFLWLTLLASKCYAQEIIYLAVSADIVINASSFNAQLFQVTTGAAEGDPLIENKKLAPLVYDANSGRFINAQLGFAIGRIFVIEMEYRRGEMAYWEQSHSDVPFLPPNVIIPAGDYMLNQTMSAVMVNIMARYDTGQDISFMAGLGIGGNSIINDYEFAQTDNTTSNASTNRIERFFSFKTMQYMTQGIFALQLQMTGEVAIIARATVCYIPAYGMENILPLSKLPGATIVNDPNATYVPYDPLRYDMFGIKPYFTTLGLGIKALF